MGRRALASIAAGALLGGIALAGGARAAERADLFGPARATLAAAVELDGDDALEFAGDAADGYFTLRLELAATGSPALSEIASSFRDLLTRGGGPTAPAAITLEEVPATSADRIRYRLATTDGRYGLLSLETTSSGADGGGALRTTLRSCVWNQRQPVHSEATCNEWMGTP